MLGWRRYLGGLGLGLLYLSRYWHCLLGWWWSLGGHRIDLLYRCRLLRYRCNLLHHWTRYWCLHSCRAMHQCTGALWQPKGRY